MVRLLAQAQRLGFGDASREAVAKGLIDAADWLIVPKALDSNKRPLSYHPTIIPDYGAFHFRAIIDHHGAVPRWNPAMSDVMLPVQQAMAEAADYAKQALAPNTRAAYRADWADFLAWCQRHDQEPLPAMPETVAAYLASMARTHSPATMRRRLVAIGQAHKLAKVDGCRVIRWSGRPCVGSYASTGVRPGRLRRWAPLS